MIIGIAGKKFSGKDTVADFLVNYYGFVKLAFANVLKKAMQILFNLSDSQLNNHVMKETIDPRWNTTPRKLLQWMGTDVLRKQFDEHFHLRRIMMDIDNLIYQKKNIVISDVRFENEAALIRQKGGVIWHIRRNGANEHAGMDIHQSEIPISLHQKDVLIYNSGTIEQLYHQIVELIKKY